MSTTVGIDGVSSRRAVLALGVTLVGTLLAASRGVMTASARPSCHRRESRELVREFVSRRVSAFDGGLPDSFVEFAHLSLAPSLLPAHTSWAVDASGFRVDWWAEWLLRAEGIRSGAPPSPPPSPPAWLRRTPAGLRVIRRDSGRLPTEGEGHPGQALLYLWLVGWKPSTGLRLVVGDAGQAYGFEAALDALGGELAIRGDNDMLLPALLLLSEKRYWNRRFGDTVDISDVARSFVVESPLERPCFGLHWLSAQVVISRDASGRVDRLTSARARRLVSEGVRAVAESCDGALNLPWARWSRPELGGAAWLVLVSHAVEFLHLAESLDQPRLQGILSQFACDLTDPKAIQPAAIEARSHVLRATGILIEHFSAR